MPLQIGSVAPDFSLPDSSGNQQTLSALRGKWVVLYFYPKDNTSGCTREAIEFTEEISSFKKLGATIIGISPDSSQSHAGFIAKHGLRIELLSDPGHSVCTLYGVWQKKKLYGREYFGVVRTTVLIDPEGIVKKVWEKVKVPGHVSEVREHLAVCRKKA